MEKILIKPLSVNTCFQGRRFKTKKYKSYEKELMLKLKPLEIPEKPYEINIEYGFSSKLSDIDNPCKPFLDVLQKKYGINDRDVYKLTQQKNIVKKGQEYIKFEIKTKIN